MRSSKQRTRSKSNRNNNNRSVGNIVNRVFESSGPEGKVRGTPQQIIEKYGQLARDAQLSNDRVAHENFQQHAEHYVRMLGEAQREAEARRELQEQQQRERQQADQQRNANNNNNNNHGNSASNNGNSGSQDHDPRHSNRDQRAQRDHQQRPQTSDQPDVQQTPHADTAQNVAIKTDLQDAPQPDVAPVAPEPIAAPVSVPDVVDMGADAGSNLVETPENAEPVAEVEAAPKPRKRAPRKPRAPKKVEAPVEVVAEEAPQAKPEDPKTPAE